MGVGTVLLEVANAPPATGSCSNALRASLFTLPLDITQRVQAQLEEAQVAAACGCRGKNVAISPDALGAELARGSSYVALDRPFDVVHVATGILDQQPDCGAAPTSCERSAWRPRGNGCKQ